VIHYIIVGILVACFEIPYKELVDTLINEGQLVQKVLENSAPPTDSSIGSHGHLLMVAKAMNVCPLLVETLKENEAWQKMMETFVKEFQNKSICPPDANMLAAKQRQIAKAGGTFLG